MTALPHSPSHPVARAAHRWCDELGDAAGTPVWSMSPVEAGETLVALTRARAQLDALLMGVLSHAETVGTGSESGATSAVNWWSHQTRTTRLEAHRTSRLAAALGRHDQVRGALATGEVCVEQARVIVEAVEDLPDEVEAWVPVEATEHLLDKARDHDAKALRLLARRLLEVIDPEAADAEEARRLAAEERDARARASLVMRDDGHGRCHGRFSIPSAVGEMLRKHLTAIASPARAAAWQAEHHAAHAAAGESGEEVEGDDVVLRPRPVAEPMLTRHRLGMALLDYIEARGDEPAPTLGGVAATVVVTMDLDTLLGGLKPASLDTGGRISAGEARRMACEAGIIPVVLDGASVVLDMGRRRRFHTEAQRIAMGLRDGGCTAHGCDAPPGLCHAHHDIAWSRGGPTSAETGRLLCPRHHRRIHDPAYHHTLDKHGQVRFTRRT
jgi:hypothetical protein